MAASSEIKIKLLVVQSACGYTFIHISVSVPLFICGSRSLLYHSRFLFYECDIALIHREVPKALSMSIQCLTWCTTPLLLSVLN